MGTIHVDAELLSKLKIKLSNCKHSWTMNDLINYLYEFHDKNKIKNVNKTEEETEATETDEETTWARKQSSGYGTYGEVDGVSWSEQDGRRYKWCEARQEYGSLSAEENEKIDAWIEKNGIED